MPGKLSKGTRQFLSQVRKTAAWDAMPKQRRLLLLSLFDCMSSPEDGVVIERSALGKLELFSRPVVTAGTRGSIENAVYREMKALRNAGLVVVTPVKRMCQPGTHGIPPHHKAKLRVVANHYFIPGEIPEWVPVADPDAVRLGESHWRYTMKQSLFKDDHLTKAQKRVGGAVLERTSPVTGCTASQADLAADADVSQQTVSKAVKALVSHHHLRREGKALFPGNYVPLLKERTTILWTAAEAVSEAVEDAEPLPHNVIPFPAGARRKACSGIGVDPVGTEQGVEDAPASSTTASSVLLDGGTAGVPALDLARAAFTPSEEGRSSGGFSPASSSTSNGGVS